ncbi:hypothetical protein [Aliirhizobium smilacinae]|uniref:Site-specific integrase n=1 Tax=Aliirhizobium smilacinae TaxID=1395944 RepID=A0A5C4XNW8_9HYPH|nr:hypothetical protein [Rhizobium smilacinae]TNM65067.1 hypothetical protein FHP24_01870 [Rhizobium smilacinae]
MVAMTSLRRAANGDWFSRKGIPSDIREAYKATYGVAMEERFRLSSSATMGQAKAELRDWDATISSRIETLRAANTGAVISLTQRQISALAGEWYRWFTELYADDAGHKDDWPSRYRPLQEIYDRFDIESMEEGQQIGIAARKRIRAKVSEMGCLATFLAEKATALDEKSLNAVIDAVELEIAPAFAALERRAAGDYSPDARLTRFADQPAHANAKGLKLSGWNFWQAFEKWVAERKPAPATVSRWRSVFLGLDSYFDQRDVATITDDEVIGWKGTLVTEKRSAAVANDVWITAAKTVFNWLLENKKVAANPFEGVRIATIKKIKVRERAFEPSEWKAILSASLAPPSPRLKPEKAAARRWVPWLCAYTGSRPGEMTQLQATSVRQQDGIWIIDISPEDGTVKGASYRRVPIHEHLIEMGFLDFVAEKKTGPLFYDPADKRVTTGDDPTKPVRPPYVIARNKLAEWVRNDVEVTDPNISPNHAWRHTFKRQAARVNMEKRFRFAFCGHESDDVGDIYETPTLEDMAEELKKFPRYVVD